MGDSPLERQTRPFQYYQSNIITLQSKKRFVFVVFRSKKRNLRHADCHPLLVIKIITKLLQKLIQKLFQKLLQKLLHSPPGKGDKFIKIRFFVTP